MEENTQQQSTNNQLQSNPPVNTQQSQAIYQNLPPVNKTNNTNTADTYNNSSLKKNALKNATIYILILLCFIALSLFIYFTLLTKHASTNVKQNNTSPMGLTEGTTPKAPKPTVPPGPVSYGQANLADITMKIDKAITDPPYKGDPPDTGMQYLEIDLTVTYTGNAVGAIPGFFYYRTGSGQEITSADVKGHGKYSNKSVLIPKKQSLYSVILMPGKTTHGVYLLFQIPPGDHGKLLWYIPNDQNTNSQQVIYNL